MEPTTHNHQYRILMIIIFLVFVIFLGAVVWSRYNLGKKEPDNTFSQRQSTNTVSRLARLGKVSLTAENNRQSISQPTTLGINAAIPNVDVVGYDILLDYDKSAFTLVSVESLVPDFDIFKSMSQEGLIITGAKKLSSQKQVIFNPTEIIKIVFKPLKPGRFNFAIRAEKGREHTQIVDTQSKVYYPETETFSITIE